ncbi:hypothetical protein N2152v2_006509 [Parachlorella kessleri]
MPLEPITTESHEPHSKRPKLGTAVPAAEVITFHLLKHTPQGLAVEENGSFPPEMCHQLFGEEEEIRGYDGLSIDVWFTPRLQPFVDVKCAGKAQRATDLREPFQRVFAAGFFEEKEGFDAALQAEEPLALEGLGEVVAEAETGEGSRIVALHARAEAFLYFFVDAASAIDGTDPRWDLLLALDETPDGLELVGFATVYKFYAYPDRCRLRLSQVLVLPPHQGRGVGSLLLRALGQQADALDAVDVTCEDPSEDLQRIRDKLDLLRMLRCDWLQEAASHRVSAAVAAPAPNGEEAEGEGASSALALAPADLARAQKELRITKQQARARREWEGLLLLLGSQLPQSERREAVGAAVRDMILRRVTNQVAAAKRDAAGKVPRTTEGGFVMTKPPRRHQAAAQGGGGGSAANGSAAGAAAAAAGSGLMPGGVPVEGVSPEQQAEEIEQAVEVRMGELQKLVESMAAAAARPQAASRDG